MTTGAQAILRQLADSGVTACFTNPGTSEMHFVAGLDDVTEIRPVLTLFEGVATGAADGFARMADRPAATLLHLGCGLSNGLANLHNARRARVPLVNIVGDHADSHLLHDAPLQSDIAAAASTVSGWLRRTSTQTAVADAAAVAAASAQPGQIATLVVPADATWSELPPGVHTRLPEPTQGATASADIEAIVRVLRDKGSRAAIILGGRALRVDALKQAHRIAASAGARLFAEVFPTRFERGAGRPDVERLAYVPELAQAQLRGIEHLILVDTRRPVAFFAYPGRTGDLVPADCIIHHIPHVAVTDALTAIAAEAGRIDEVVAMPQPSLLARPTGPLTAEKVCAAIGRTLPPWAIVSDESNTSGLRLARASAGAPPHDVLTLTGGAIGQGLPVAVGAAVACPHRPVLALEADGSALYTIQSLWTMARESLDVTVVLLNNSAYSILDIEMQRVKAGKLGERARSQLQLDNPAIDFVRLARGFGVPAERPDTAEDLVAELSRAFAEPGPHLIEVRIASTYRGLRLKAMPYALGAIETLPGRWPAGWADV